jgi:proline iminopeptidase
MCTNSDTAGQAHAGRWLYPPQACHTSGWLDVGHGHEVWWEESGNPLGQPALFVHGGPGAGCKPNDRRWFDPSRYRIVTFDQRGCGRSRPLGDVAHTAIHDLVEDMEALRRHLRIAHWVLLGGSWGATLALAYAQRHPLRVTAMVLRGVYTASAAERRWLYGASGAARLQPQDWQRFIAPVPPGQRGDVPAAYQRLLDSRDPAVQHMAARAWLVWEQALMSHEGAGTAAETPTTLDPAQLAMARIGVHFARHGDGLGSDRSALAGIPGVIVQGALDRVTPPGAALALHLAWPSSRLQILPDAGHASRHPHMARQLIAATDEFASPHPFLSTPIEGQHQEETRDERRSHTVV